MLILILFFHTLTNSLSLPLHVHRIYYNLLQLIFPINSPLLLLFPPFNDLVIPGGLLVKWQCLGLLLLQFWVIALDMALAFEAGVSYMVILAKAAQYLFWVVALEIMLASVAGMLESFVVCFIFCSPLVCPHRIFLPIMFDFSKW